MLKTLLVELVLEGVGDICREVGSQMLNPRVRLTHSAVGGSRKPWSSSWRQREEQSHACCGSHGFSGIKRGADTELHLKSPPKSPLIPGGVRWAEKGVVSRAHGGPGQDPHKKGNFHR